MTYTKLEYRDALRLCARWLVQDTKPELLAHMLDLLRNPRNHYKAECLHTPERAGLLLADVIERIQSEQRREEPTK